MDVDELDPVERQYFTGLVDHTRANLWAGFLQIAGSLLLALGVALWSVPAGLCVLGSVMVLFGIAAERGLAGRVLPDAG